VISGKEMKISLLKYLNSQRTIALIALHMMHQHIIFKYS